MITIITPIIHLNGDRKETLIDNLEKADDAIRAAWDALYICYLNARNYYPEPGRYEKAEAQHRKRLDHLDKMLKSLDEEINQIHEENQTLR